MAREYEPRLEHLGESNAREVALPLLLDRECQFAFGELRSPARRFGELGATGPTDGWTSLCSSIRAESLQRTRAILPEACPADRMVMRLRLPSLNGRE